MRLTANGYDNSFREDKNDVKLHDGDGCTTLWIFFKNIPLYTLKGKTYGM